MKKIKLIATIASSLLFIVIAVLGVSYYIQNQQNIDPEDSSASVLSSCRIDYNNAGASNYMDNFRLNGTVNFLCKKYLPQESMLQAPNYKFKITEPDNNVVYKNGLALNTENNVISDSYTFTKPGAYKVQCTKCTSAQCINEDYDNRIIVGCQEGYQCTNNQCLPIIPDRPCQIDRDCGSNYRCNTATQTCESTANIVSCELNPSSTACGLNITINTSNNPPADPSNTCANLGEACTSSGTTSNCCNEATCKNSGTTSTCQPKASFNSTIATKTCPASYRYDITVSNIRPIADNISSSLMIAFYSDNWTNAQKDQVKAFLGTPDFSNGQYQFGYYIERSNNVSYAEGSPFIIFNIMPTSKVGSNNKTIKELGEWTARIGNLPQYAVAANLRVNGIQNDSIGSKNYSFLPSETSTPDCTSSSMPDGSITKATGNDLSKIYTFTANWNNTLGTRKVFLGKCIGTTVGSECKQVQTNFACPTNWAPQGTTANATGNWCTFTYSGNNPYTWTFYGTNSNIANGKYVVGVGQELGGNNNCSGNPTCTVNGGPTPCGSQWMSCSDNDYVEFTVPVTAVTPTPGPTPQTCIPTLIAPANNSIINTNPTFRWSSCNSGDMYYKINIKQNNTVIKSQLINPATSSEVSIVLATNFVAGTTYTWNIQPCLETICTDSLVSQTYTFAYQAPLTCATSCKTAPDNYLCTDTRGTQTCRSANLVPALENNGWTCTFCGASTSPTPPIVSPSPSPTISPTPSTTPVVSPTPGPTPTSTNCLGNNAVCASNQICKTTVTPNVCTANASEVCTLTANKSANCVLLTIVNRACVVTDKANGTSCGTAGETCQSGLCTNPTTTNYATVKGINLTVNLGKRKEKANYTYPTAFIGVWRDAGANSKMLTSKVVGLAKNIQYVDAAFLSGNGTAEYTLTGEDYLIIKPEGYLSKAYKLKSLTIQSNTTIVKNETAEFLAGDTIMDTGTFDSVNVRDYVFFRDFFGRDNTYDYYYIDFNGSGNITIHDAVEFRNNLGKTGATKDLNPLVINAIQTAMEGSLYKVIKL